MALFLIGLQALYSGLNWGIEYYLNKKSASIENPNYEEENPTKVETKNRVRLQSLDTFRGICITIMIFVNYGGGQYWFFNHSPWHGLTVADLVMPWFMFMMGVSFTFSIKSMTKKNFTRRQITHKIVMRSIKLFVLGLFIINSATSFDSIRIMGVLQRFGIGYLVGMLPGISR